MQLKENLTPEVGVILKSIDYKLSEEIQKPTLNAKDSYKIINKSSEEITVLFTREVRLQTKNAYILKVEVEFKRYPKEGINLEELLTDDVIKENIDDLCSPIFSYVSLLISQITSTFNRPPVITPPTYLE